MFINKNGANIPLITSNIQKHKKIPVRTEKKGKSYMEKMIKNAKAGDPDAFTRLMKSQMQGMYKTAGAILMNDEDIADAVSDTILSCW